MAGRIVVRDRQCRQCGKSPITGHKFCSPECRTVAGYRRNGARPRADVNAERIARIMADCRVCGMAFPAYSEPGAKVRVCSLECRHILRRWRGECERALTQAKRDFAKWAQPRYFKGHARLTQLRRRRERAGALCGDCSEPIGWARARRAGTTMCQECRDRRNAEAVRAYRKKRKAAKRAVTVETVHPLRVFERDGWRCHLCGGMTDKTKRGTPHPSAPELDHIVPLSKGGPHSYANTACAHKRCNAAKSDKIIGQPSLLAA